MAAERAIRRLVHGVVALSLSLFLLGISPSLQMRHLMTGTVGYILYLPEFPAMLVRNMSRNLSNWFVGREDLNKKIEELIAEVEALRMENSALSAEKTRVAVNTITENADVVLRTPETWWSEIRINKGKANGLEVGSPVYRSGFLLGRISSVEDKFAWVELLTSSSLMLPVVVEETRDLGVIGGDGEGHVWLHYIPDNRGIKEGMKISTALIGDKLPPGLRVGIVSSESIISPNGFRSMKIILGADMSRLYAVSFKKPDEVN